MRVMLLGGTDLTLAIAERLTGLGVTLAGVVHVPRQFGISYEPNGVTNTRFADLGEWCAAREIPGRAYDGPDSIAEHAAVCAADFALVAGWYHMVPRSVRRLFPRGCAGLHASLLPRLRGGAPLAWAILSGASEAGMSLFELGDGIDDGPIYGQRAIPIGPRSTVGELVAAAEVAALELVAACVPRIASHQLTPRPQTGTPSYSLQRAPQDGRIDWSRPAVDIDRLIRAVGRPYPGAFTTFDDNPVFIWAAELLEGVEVLGTPGQLARIPGVDETCVVTGAGGLRLVDVTDSLGGSCLGLLRQSANRRFTS